ncbi:NAD(P)H-binding protein [Oxyplasma meridianum]|uniref:NAD(P)H-binding protein n=1 Tax=Oxyplasma meridianum TaxID=3073602 RepID=A0AAX4NG89_9ARCH
MKAIVLGSGYMGKNVAMNINADSVAYFSRHEVPELKERNIRWIEGDILDSEKVMEAIKDFDKIYYAVGVWKGEREKLFDAHVNGMKNVAAAVKKYDTNQRIINLSFINVHYGKLELFRIKSIEEDNAATIKNHLNVRMSPVYGEGDTFTKKLVDLASQNLPNLPDGGNLAPIHILDAIKVIEASEGTMGAIDLCGTEKLRFADMINIVRSIMGKGEKSVTESGFFSKRSVSALAEKGIFDEEDIERYLMNYYRETTWINRFVKEPHRFKDYAQEAVKLGK